MDLKGLQRCKMVNLEIVNYFSSSDLMVLLNTCLYIKLFFSFSFRFFYQKNSNFHWPGLGPARPGSTDRPGSGPSPGQLKFELGIGLGLELGVSLVLGLDLGVGLDLVPVSISVSFSVSVYLDLGFRLELFLNRELSLTKGR